MITRDQLDHSDNPTVVTRDDILRNWRADDVPLVALLLTLLASSLVGCDGSHASTSLPSYRRIAPVRNSLNHPGGPLLFRGSQGDRSDILVSRALDAPLEILVPSSNGLTSWGLAADGEVYFSVVDGDVSVFDTTTSQLVGTVSLPDSGMSRHATSPNSQVVAFWNESTGDGCIVNIGQYEVVETLKLGTECEYFTWVSGDAALVFGSASADQAPVVQRVASGRVVADADYVLPVGSVFAGIWKEQIAWTVNGGLWSSEGEIGVDLAHDARWIWALSGAVVRYDGVRLTVEGTNQQQVVSEDFMGLVSAGVPQLVAGGKWLLALATHEEVLLVIASSDGSVTFERRRVR